MLEIRFLSEDKLKIEEASLILKEARVSVVPVNIKVEELQTADTSRLIKDKALKAFEEIGRPLFVEHTGLYIDYMNGLPGGLTQLLWETLQADKFTKLLGKDGYSSLVAKTMIGFVDGKQFHIFEGSVKGHVSANPMGDRCTQWDCIFIPEGESQTLAEMGEKKSEYSMMRKALDQFSLFLENRGHV